MNYLIFVLGCALLLPLQIYLGSNSFKDRLTLMLGEKLMKSIYRLIYILLTLGIYFVCVRLYLNMPEQPLFSWQDSVSNLLFLILDTIRFIALFLVIEAVWELDLVEFLGIKQAWFLLTRKDISAFKRNRIRSAEYVPKGLYLRHRQPVFFYIILFFILDRTISVADIMFLLVFIPYFHFNSKQQEARLLEDYGMSYQTYLSRVRKYWPMMKRYPLDEKPKK